MENNLVVIIPQCAERAKSERLRAVLNNTIANIKPEEIIETADQLHPLQGKRILFAIVLGSSGINLEYYKMLKQIRLNQHMFDNCLGALLVDGKSELYTKYIAREIVLAANMAGCAFIGRPLVEGTASLDNFHIIAQLQNLDAYGAYLWSAHDLLSRLMSQSLDMSQHRKLLVLHASSPRTSNTYALWKMVEEHIQNIEIQEISLRGKAINDCAGCPYETCLHFGSKGSCFYGGAIIEEVYPALTSCTDLMLLCPNYNDAVSAYLTAFINRLTALYLKQRFYDKHLYAIIVSGYSGSDIIAGQLIAGLCMNKSFFLPPHFCLMETAHEEGSIQKKSGIKEIAAQFAEDICHPNLMFK